MIERVCEECGKKYIASQHNQKYCSKRCQRDHTNRIYRWNKILKKQEEKKMSVGEITKIAWQEHRKQYGDYVGEEYAKTIKVVVPKGLVKAKDKKR